MAQHDRPAPPNIVQLAPSSLHISFTAVLASDQHDRSSSWALRVRRKFFCKAAPAGLSAASSWKMHAPRAEFLVTVTVHHDAAWEFATA